MTAMQPKPIIRPYPVCRSAEGTVLLKMLQTTDPKDIAFPGLADRYRRTTHVLDEALRRIGLALGGRPARAWPAGWAAATSRMTLLRLIDALPVPSPPWRG